MRKNRPLVLRSNIAGSWARGGGDTMLQGELQMPWRDLDAQTQPSISPWFGKLRVSPSALLLLSEGLMSIKRKGGPN